jgi:hypothetical protein
VAPVERAGCCAASIERFQNSRALLRVFKGGIFSMKMPLGTRGSAVQQFWNRCRRNEAATLGAPFATRLLITGRWRFDAPN